MAVKQFQSVDEAHRYYTELLSNKQQELDAVQASFDEFTTSSQELEQELEDELRTVGSPRAWLTSLNPSVFCRRRAVCWN